MALSFAPDAAERWRSLASSQHAYERSVRNALRPILNSLDKHPELHRVGAIQFQTTPTTWARTVDIGEGAGWVIIWTTGAEPGQIRILRIEPAPTLA